MLHPKNRITCSLFALALNTVCSAQPGVFTVGIAQDSMAAFLVGDTVQAPWQSNDTYAFDPDNDGIIDLLVQSMQYTGGLGGGYRLSVVCGDSTLLATTTAIDSADAVFGGPVTVPVPQQFELGEQTTGNEFYDAPPFLNHSAYSVFPGGYTNNLHAWNTVLDGYLVFRKVEAGGVHYGWLRIDTYGPQSCYAVVKEVGYQALALAVPPAPVEGNGSFLWTGDALLLAPGGPGTLAVTDAAGRAVLLEPIAAGSAQRIGTAHWPAGLYCATFHGAPGQAVLRFVVVGP